MIFIGFILVTIYFLMQLTAKYNGDVIIAPIKGLMIGALYNDDIDDEETEHTIQIVIFVISITYIWTTTNGLKK
jgi:alkylhydroperoxidase/carboxymuconolactone decarboxylase family protein YurZ